MKKCIFGLILFTLLACNGRKLPENEGISSPIQAARQEIADLDRKGMIINSGPIYTYIQNLAQQVVPEEKRAENYKFYLVKNPQINAFATADKTMIINLGLIARAENEVQLAQVIAHEMGHSLMNHVQEAFENTRQKMKAAHFMDLALFGTGIAYLPFAASLASYSQDHENDADAYSVKRLSELGYDITKTDGLFKILSETKEVELQEGSIWSSHPGNKERIENVHKLVESGQYPTNAGGKITSAEFEAIKKLAVIENTELKLISRQYSLAADSIEEQLKIDNSDPELYFLKGEAFRNMAEDPTGLAKEYAWINDEDYSDTKQKEMEAKKPEYLSTSINAYNNALKLNPNKLESYKGLGLAKRLNGDPTYVG